MKKCKICNNEFEARSNSQVYCSPECRKRAYENYQFSTPEATEKYRERIKEEEGFDDTAFNYEFRERTAANKNMTTTEYNRYLEERKAVRLGLSVKELRHYTYLSKKHGFQLYEELGISQEEYKKRLK